jgi:hypothetical protein
MSARRYVAWPEKHKAPIGFGSRCPDMPETQAGVLLERAIEDPSGSAKLFAVDGEWCFEAHRNADGTYHGFPRPGAELDERVLRAHFDRGLIGRGQMNRLRRQKRLPEGYS